ncbi:hypothetical protein BJ508DRAFT_417483 [Ascobolus immersus RN42]|uniref:BTB domain-containing protein n=1 Tax=Ascobolus immersus RN42 TaxID=1160509 RepID=A0A3N4HSB7_ASCIM|nr:hypothetical protein BJ508DRAFT_417483 [Ascobolus immersus RN42]
MTDSRTPSNLPSQRLPLRPRIPDTRNEATLSLLRTGKWSDLTLKCGDSDEVFRVHKTIVCSQSEFFEACVESGMKESGENEIRLVEEEPADVARMLEFLYGGAYWEHAKEEGGKTSEEIYLEHQEEMLKDGETVGGLDGKEDPVMVNARMFVLADKYGIPTLRKEAVRKMKSFVDVAVRRQVSDGEEMDRATKMARQWRRILNAVGFLCGRTTDDEPSRVLLDRVVARVPQMSEGGSLGVVYMEDLKRRCSENPDMANLVVDMMSTAWTKDDKATDDGWKTIHHLTDDFFATVETLIQHTRNFLLDPAKIAKLRCTKCQPPSRPLPRPRSTAPLPLQKILPVLETRVSAEGNTIWFPVIKWKCNGCGYTDEQEEFAIVTEEVVARFDGTWGFQ